MNQNIIKGLSFLFVIVILSDTSCKKNTATIPTLTTTAINAITNISASSGGNITNAGGSTVTARGVCWNTSPNPTVSNDTTINGTGPGIFKSLIHGLTLGVTYYARAYATNGTGTGYGNQLVFTTVFGIGSSYGGGIVAYIFQPGDSGCYKPGQTHGLIAAPTDQSTGIRWYNGSYKKIGGTTTEIGAGMANTDSIVLHQGKGNYAASLCKNLSLTWGDTASNIPDSVYSDWYLPSLNELNELYLNQAAIGGFSNNYYWSSTESDSTATTTTNAWFQYFAFGFQYDLSKSRLNHVRAVRTF